MQGTSAILIQHAGTPRPGGMMPIPGAAALRLKAMTAPTQRVT